jgi:hypothetical protein
MGAKHTLFDAVHCPTFNTLSHRTLHPANSNSSSPTRFADPGDYEGDPEEADAPDPTPCSLHQAYGCGTRSFCLLATNFPAPRTPQLLHHQQTVPPLPNPAIFSNITRFADPGYYEGDPEDEGAPDPLTACLPNKESHQHIPALPAQPGAALLFTHRWGGGVCRMYS